MSGHPQSSEDFDLYVLGVLDDDEHELLEEHFRSCDQCRHKLDAARGRISLLGLAVPPVVPSPAVRGACWARSARGRLLQPSVDSA